MGMFHLWGIAVGTTMPVASIKLEEEDDPLVLHIPIHTIAVFCNHFFV
jgi:hypothetical protein